MSGAAAVATDASEHAFTLPRVSVIVVNFNYGAYLAAAIDSVFAQTYGHVECVLIDNGSTDDSPAVIDALAARHPAMRVVRRPDNGGQSLASLEGFSATRSPYVTFLDADDVMLPDFLATHMFVHLSLRVPLGFTCSDMFQTLGDDLVLGTFAPLNAYVREGVGRDPDLLRPVDRGEADAGGGCDLEDGDPGHAFPPMVEIGRAPEARQSKTPARLARRDRQVRGGCGSDRVMCCDATKWPAAGHVRGVVI